MDLETLAERIGDENLLRDVRAGSPGAERYLHARLEQLHEPNASVVRSKYGIGEADPIAQLPEQAVDEIHDTSIRQLKYLASIEPYR